HRYLELRTEDRLRVGDRQTIDQVRAITHETWVFLDLEHHQDIATGSPPHPGIPLTTDRDVTTSRDTGGDLDLNRLLAPLHPLATTTLARLLYPEPSAMTGRTGRDTHYLAEERTLYTTDLAQPL